MISHIKYSGLFPLTKPVSPTAPVQGYNQVRPEPALPPVTQRPVKS
jgi:hypothetical protein